jgi:hypothetical protein
MGDPFMEIFDPRSVDSPIAPLLAHVGGAAVFLAPERKKELLEIWTKHVIEIRAYTKESPYGSVIAAVTMVKAIFLDVPALESLWVHAYWYQVYLHVLQTYVQRPAKFDPIKDTEFQSAFPFLAHGWLKAIGQQSSHDWPSDAARPDRPNPEDLNLEAANRVFLRMLGFAILHETGHIVHNHSGYQESPEESVRKEYEADDWACEWVFARWRDHKNDPGEFVRRSVTVAFTLSLQSALDVYFKKPGMHPCTPDRLLHFFEKFIWPETSMAQHFVPVETAVRVIIGTNLKIGGHEITMQCSFKEYLEAARPFFGCHDNKSPQE